MNTSNLTLKVALASGSCAMLSLSLFKHINDSLPMMFVWMLLGAFIGFILTEPKRFSRELKKTFIDLRAETQREKRKIHERKKEREEFLEQHADEYEFYKKAYKAKNSLFVLLLSFVICSIFLLEVLIDYHGGEMSFLVGIKAYGCFFALTLLFTSVVWTSGTLMINTSGFDSCWAQCSIYSEKNDYRYAIKAFWALLFFPISFTLMIIIVAVVITCFLILFLEIITRNTRFFLGSVLIIFAKTCRSVQNTGRWCAVVGSIVGFFYGAYFGKSEIVAFVVGATVGGGVHGISVLLSKALPDPDQQYPKFRFPTKLTDFVIDTLIR